jgi:hypothetical protein
MSILHFYLGEGGRAAVFQGQARMTTRVAAAVTAAGWQVKLCPAEERATIPARSGIHGGFHLVLNEPVPSPNCLTLRRVGWEPFWRIEQTNDRWDWQIAAQSFDPAAQSQTRAEQFLGYWSKQLFGQAKATKGGGIFVPLQGKLCEQRHFQAASPLEMVEAVARRWPERAVRLTLHPREVYPEKDRAALTALLARLPNAELSTTGSDALLLACDLLVTQNSTMALRGYVAQKPAMLWARIDFHHIAASVPRDGLRAAFATAEAGTRPDFGRYLNWYFRENCLRSWDDAVEDAIRARLRAHGWPI